jgi:hypothetical protein
MCRLDHWTTPRRSMPPRPIELDEEAFLAGFADDPFDRPAPSAGRR